MIMIIFVRFGKYYNFNIMKKCLTILLKSMLALAVAVSFFGSCANKEMWDKLNDLEARLDSLEMNLNNQVAALNALMSNGSTISSCVKNGDGSYLIELSDGTKFTAMPDSVSFASIVSCMQIDGKPCWATCDASGNLQPLRDDSGKPIPVDTKFEVKVKDGAYYLVINGKEFLTSYDDKDVVQVFSSCTPMEDASGQVYAVKFTLGEGWEITVTVDGYKGALFMLSNVNRTVLTEYYIDYGKSQTFLVDVNGIVDYVMQIPDGWRVKETVEELSGDLYVTITAPTKETVAMNAAVPAGDLKVVSVVDGGKAAITRLSLSTEPFKKFDVGALKAVVKAYTGVPKFIYGISNLADYDKDEIISQITQHLVSSSDLPEGSFESSNGIDLTHEEIYPGISEDETYIFWAIPVLYNESEDESAAGYYVAEEMFREYNLTPMSAKIEASAPTLLDAQLSVRVLGAVKMYAGVAPKTDNVLTEIVTQVNNGVYDPITDPALFSYSGPASEFPDAEAPSYLEPNSAYVAWVLPVETGKTKFTVADVMSAEFTTLDITEGGSLEVSVSEAVLTPSSISQTVSCEDAAMIYYAYLSDDLGKRASTYGNASKWGAIKEAETFAAVRGNTVDAAVTGLMPETTMWLFAAPVGHDGKYGEVSCVEVASQKVQFNSSISLKLEKVEILSDEATLKVTATKGTPTEYVYWVGRKTDPFWVETCGGMKDNASLFMAANPDHEMFAKIMKKNPPIAADGTMKLTDLAIAKEHVALIIAKDETGLYSKCAYIAFETMSISLGDDYAEEGTEKWKTAKKYIEDNIDWIENYFTAGSGNGQGFASYAFDIKVPTNCTAYISCYTTVAAMNNGMKMDIMVELEETCSSFTSVGKAVIDPVTGESPRHPDWYDDKGRLIQGSLVNIYDSYAHGNPNAGMVTYFAQDAHNETHCGAWKNGECSNYAHLMESIEKLTSLEYWREYIVEFGNYAYLGDPNHEYSRTLKDPEKIESIANQYWEIYKKYYEGVTPHVYVNDGSPLRVINREATGVDENGDVLDVVTVMLKDIDGNYYDPMYFPVPNYFTK